VAIAAPPLTNASFVYLAADQTINQAAKLRYMTGGQLKVPIMIRACTFYNNNTAAQHADRPYPLFMNVPGLKVLTPATATDAKGLLKSTIRHTISPRLRGVVQAFLCRFIRSSETH